MITVHVRFNGKGQWRVAGDFSTWAGATSCRRIYESQGYQVSVLNNGWIEEQPRLVFPTVPELPL